MTGISEENAFRAKKIGEKLTSLRHERKLTRQEFADMSGIHYMTLCQMERGNGMKNIVKFALFCERIGVSPDYFFIDD